jgi:hypothetical protein
MTVIQFHPTAAGIAAHILGLARYARRMNE